ncbi:zonular occludens toxin domain-containing protein [Lysobacter sp. CFH 32150]|uniref:zonular occludens toxin domain-containing protein n=1 Tax=Lysobacter sp. CFH 32150 TaxID=2927128 RepID=UPI001FA804CD|nr:zonular occludens toxin domain-containing protein [Lysobacter sp. CFH 32150]MCI4566352.1 hypothetical protein [Lysobacter sp. CFH 32150]
MQVFQGHPGGRNAIRNWVTPVCKHDDADLVSCLRLPDGAVALVDEAYEHGMLPKRGPGMKVPHHVEQLAKHRHRGLDFIFVSQSPARQVDDFVHDLIEEHVHVRRRFGTQFVHLRCFDKFERNPDKAHPIWLKRVTLPKRPRGLYESTKLDTTQKRIPWYYWAAAALAIAIPLGVFLVGSDVKRKLEGEGKPGVAVSDGAGATALTAKPGAVVAEITAQDVLQQVTPRIAGMPWSAPAWDERRVRSDPEIFCASSSPGFDANGDPQPDTCSCITEQGTDYELQLAVCRTIARHGPAYNPYKSARHSNGAGRGAGESPLRVWPHKRPLARRRRFKV